MGVLLDLVPQRVFIGVVLAFKRDRVVVFVRLALPGPDLPLIKEWQRVRIKADYNAVPE